MRKINRLYKYTSVDFIESCLENGVYASKLDQLNDPYEKKGIVDPDQFRVVCMTNSKMKMLMWSYYGKHKGICIEYKVNDAVRDFLKPVKYTSRPYNRRYLSKKEIIDDLGKKGKEWRHELEYRAVFHVDDSNPVWKRIAGTDNVFLDLPVSKVIVGCEVSEEDLEKVVKAVSEYNKKSKETVKIECLMLKDDRHELVVDKQFDAQKWKRKTK